MPLIDHFGLIAPFYDRALKVGNADRLIRLVNPSANDYLLDAAGGTGRIAIALQPLVRHTVVLDESQAMLVEARTKHGLLLAAGRTERSPFPSEHFDRIIMIDALHHVEDHVQTARELWRILKPGGRLVIQELDLAKGVVKLVALFEKLALMRTHFLHPEKIAGLFAAAASASSQSSPPPVTQIEREGYNVWIIIEKAGS